VVEFLRSEAGVTLLGAVFGAIWAAFKGSDWYQRWLTDRYNRALLALEAAVEMTYETYVREVRLASEDGVLTQQERDTARRRAIQTAIGIGRVHGLDIVSVLGEEYLPMWIARIVESREVGGLVESPYGR
jgi:hypothetical protein